MPVEPEEVFETPDVEENNLVDIAKEFRPSRNENIDEQPVAPHRAFEVFMGKTYDSAQFDVSETHGVVFPHQHDYEVCPADQLESPLQRFTRLQNDMMRLNDDLQQLAKDKQERQIDANSQAEYDEMTRGIQMLSSQLQDMSTNETYRSFLTSETSSVHPNFQSGPVLEAIQKFKTQSQDVPSSKGITYELFYNEKLNQQQDAMRLAKLEERIHQLEQLVGNPTLDSKTGGLVSTLESLEERVKLLDEKNLDAVSTRVSGLIHKYQMLNRQKEQPAVADAAKQQEEAKKIQSMLSKLDSLEEMEVAFPSILNRLESLKQLHDKALHFNDRLGALERSSDNTAQLLQSDMALLAKMETKMQENLLIFESNIKTLGH